MFASCSFTGAMWQLNVPAGLGCILQLTFLVDCLTLCSFCFQPILAVVAQEAVEEGRDAKRRRRDMRELRPLDAGREDRVRDRDRDRPRNDERPSREERDRERHEW